MSGLLWDVEIYEERSEARSLRSGAAVPAHQDVDPRTLRNVLGTFATGVTVVTYEANDSYRGVTVNSFTSVSLDPPLVLVSLMRTSKSLNYVQDRHFAINILSDTQLSTALSFAGKPDEGDAIEWVTDEKAPRINGSHAYFTCTPWSSYDGGDHVLLLGRVLGFGQQSETKPLLFYRGTWGALSPHGEDET